MHSGPNAAEVIAVFSQRWKGDWEIFGRVPAEKYKQEIGDKRHASDNAPDRD